MLAEYKASLADLVAVLENAAQPSPPAQDRGPSDEELIRALAVAIRRVEGRQIESEGRLEQRLEQLEKDLGRIAG